MGSWSGHTVVARRLKPKKGIPQQRLDDLGREYMRLRIFSHDNLLPMLAVALEPNVYLIGLYMKLGSLYHVLHSEDSGGQVLFVVYTWFDLFTYVYPIVLLSQENYVRTYVHTVANTYYVTTCCGKYQHMFLSMCFMYVHSWTGRV